MYTVKNFRTKKDLKAAVQEYKDGTGKPVRVFQPGPFSGSVPDDGKVYLEGPHFPEPHKWYAEAWLEDGAVVKVK